MSICPVFGGSENNFVLDSSHYTQIIKAFLDSLKIAPKIIIAHSFGGKIATLLALESQDFKTKFATRLTRFAKSKKIRPKFKARFATNPRPCAFILRWFAKKTKQ